MTLPDNRIKFDSALIDFETTVGTTGQDHDTYPAPDTSPRYDWFRMVLIGLLSNQASYDIPTQYRDGTTYFDLNTLSFKIYAQNAWRSLSEVIALSEGTDTESTLTLAEWYSAVQETLVTTAPESTFSGRCTADGATTINLPSTISERIDTVNNRAFIYKNGILIDPRKCSLTEANITLTGGITLSNGDTFTIVIKNIAQQLFSVPDVLVS